MINYLKSLYIEPRSAFIATMRLFPISLFFYFSCCIVLTAYSQEQSVPSQTSIEKIDHTIEAFLAKWSIPGASVAIVKSDKLVYAKGYGYANVATQQAVTPTHKFRIASVSKPITAVAIFTLIEEGKLTLYDQVFGPNGLLDDFTLRDERMLDITVYHLLTHSAGWNREDSGDPMFESLLIAKAQKVLPPATQTDIVKYMLGRSLDFPPGTDYAYSNFGYCILGRVIEKVSGMSYEWFVKERVLNRCGITTMEIGQSSVTGPNKAIYYTEKKEALSTSVFDPNQKRRPTPYEGFYLEAMDAHGGWIASSVDLMKFLVRVNGLPEKSDILSKKSIQTMGAPSPVNDNYALGWAVNQYDNWWHLGSLPGTSSMIANIHDGTGWCILTNKRSLHDDYLSALDQLMWDAVQNVEFDHNVDLFANYSE